MPRRVRVTWPTVREIVLDLESYREELAEYGEPDGDVRLQVLPNGEWELWTGDPSYDTDHRGYWGAGTLDAEASALEMRELARDLIEEARDAWEESEA